VRQPYLRDDTAVQALSLRRLHLLARTRDAVRDLVHRRGVLVREPLHELAGADDTVYSADALPAAPDVTPSLGRRGAAGGSGTKDVRSGRCLGLGQPLRVLYCSAMCQRADWGAHKAACQTAAASRSADTASAPPSPPPLLPKRNAGISATTGVEVPMHPRRVVEIMASRPRDMAVMAAGCAALCTASAGSGASMTALGLAVILCALSAHRYSSNAVLAGCCALRCVALEHPQEVASAGGIPALVRSLGTFGQVAHIVQECCAALRVFTYAADTRAQKAVDHSAVPALVAVLHLNRAVPAIVLVCAAALRNIAFKADARAQAVASSGGILALVEALCAHPTAVDVMKECCAALRNIADRSDARAQAVVDAGGIRAIVATLSPGPSPSDGLAHARLILAGRGALRTIAAGSADRRREVVEGGGGYLLE